MSRLCNVRIRSFISHTFITTNQPNFIRQNEQTKHVKIFGPPVTTKVKIHPVDV